MLGIRYPTGGPVASSARGIARATRAIDIVARVRIQRLLPWEWYADPDRIIFPAGGEFYVVPLAFLGIEEAYSVASGGHCPCQTTVVSPWGRSLRAAVESPDLDFEYVRSWAAPLKTHVALAADRAISEGRLPG